MAYFVYILRSRSDGRFYTGSTEDVIKRIKEHNSGKVRSTKARRPLELIYQEAYETRTEARKRENYFKSGEGRRLLKKKLNLGQ
jgi:putative endonuclease